MKVKKYKLKVEGVVKFNPCIKLIRLMENYLKKANYCVFNLQNNNYRNNLIEYY